MENKVHIIKEKEVKNDFYATNENGKCLSFP